METTPNVEAIRAEAVEAKAEAAEMFALGKRHNAEELASEFLINSRSIDGLRTAILERKSVTEKPVAQASDEIGLTQKRLAASPSCVPLTI